jgi:6-phosphogluconolactonase
MLQEIRRTLELDKLIAEAASFISENIHRCVKERGVFTLALSGGSSPRPLYHQLSQPPFRHELPWKKIHVFWGDERCVPPTHKQSNFGMAFDLLLSKVPLPQKNIHRIPTEMEPPQEAAKAYRTILSKFFEIPLEECELDLTPTNEMPFPSFDLILLGMGKDGHAASLFPGDPILEEKSLWVAAVRAPEGMYPACRITLTLPVINHAANVLFLVSGPDKREVVQAILHHPTAAASHYPAAMVRPSGRCVWFIHEQAD